MFRRNALLIGACLAGAVAFTSVDVQAQQIQGIRPEVHLDLGWWEAAGVGFRIDIPIVPNGFLRSGSVRDELALSPGADLWLYWANNFCHTHSGTTHCHNGGTNFGLWPILTLQWNLYFGNSGWSIFPEAGLVMGLFDSPWFWGGWNGAIWISPTVGFGARYHFNQRLALLMRVMFPGGLQIGLTF